MRHHLLSFALMLTACDPAGATVDDAGRTDSPSLVDASARDRDALPVSEDAGRADSASMNDAGAGESDAPDPLEDAGRGPPDSSLDSDAGADDIFAAATLSETGRLLRFFGVSVRLEGLVALDARGLHAWEVSEASFLRATDVRFPPGSQSYLIEETDGATELSTALLALEATNSRTHAPQFTDGHLRRTAVTRWSMANEPPIHRDEFLAWGDYETWAQQMLELTPFRESSYIQTAQAGTILFMVPLSPAQRERWDAASARWMSGELRCRGVASTEKTRDLAGSRLELLRTELDLYAARFPGAALWLTEWNAMGGELEPTDEEMRLSVAEMLLAMARLDVERPEAIDALHYHQGWGTAPGSLLRLVDGRWTVSPAGEVYRAFAPLFRGQHVQSWALETSNIVAQAFVSADGAQVIAYVNKGTAPAEIAGRMVGPRTYGVLDVL